MTRLKYKNKLYVRDVELLGDVEKIKWFESTDNTNLEVFDQELVDKLEIVYEYSVIKEITPALPII